MLQENANNCLFSSMDLFHILLLEIKFMFLVIYFLRYTVSELRNGKNHVLMHSFVSLRALPSQNLGTTQWPWQEMQRWVDDMVPVLQALNFLWLTCSQFLSVSSSASEGSGLTLLWPMDQTSSISTTWEFVRSIESLDPSQTLLIKICMLQSFPGGFVCTLKFEKH